jgi:hypothetical protein
MFRDWSKLGKLGAPLGLELFITLERHSIDLIFEASPLSTTVNQGLHKLDTGCSHDGHASSARAKRDSDFPPADSCYFSPTTRARSRSLWELSIRDWQCCRSQIREPRPSRPYHYPNSRGQSWNTVPDTARIFRCPWKVCVQG